MTFQIGREVPQGDMATAFDHAQTPRDGIQRVYQTTAAAMIMIAIENTSANVPAMSIIDTSANTSV
ncbi:hypothetical protein MnTg02_02054 [bacterium MnTg02]|nr:hypothetical protein MnTg02_02054 [bacterium MnTg02]